MVTIHTVCVVYNFLDILQKMQVMKTNIVSNIKIRSLNVWYIKTSYPIVMKFTELIKLDMRTAYINFLSNLKFCDT